MTYHRFGSPFENQLLPCQDNPRSENQTWERADSIGDARQFQTHGSSRPSQGESEATGMPFQLLFQINTDNTKENNRSTTIPVQWMAGCEPPISSTLPFDLATLAQANLPSLPHVNTAYQYDLAGLAQDNLPPLPQENSVYQFDLAILAQANLPPLPPDTVQFEYDAAEPTPDHLFAVLPQPLSINV